MNGQSPALKHKRWSLRVTVAFAVVFFAIYLVLHLFPTKRSDPFGRQVDGITTGMTLEQVKQVLGEPDRRQARPGSLKKDRNAPIYNEAGKVIGHLSRFVPGDPVLHFRVGRSGVRVEFDDENRVRKIYEYTTDDRIREADGAELIKIENGSALFEELSNVPALSRFSLQSANEISGVSLECWVSVEEDGTETKESERLRLDRLSFAEKQLASDELVGQILFARQTQSESMVVESGIEYRENFRLVLTALDGGTEVSSESADVEVVFGVLPNTLSGRTGRVESIGITHSAEPHSKELPEELGQPFVLWSGSLKGNIVDPDGSGQVGDRKTVIRVMCRDLVSGRD